MRTSLTSSQQIETPARRKLRQFESAKAGWHFGDGGPLAYSVVALARLLLGWAESLQLEADVFSGTDGSCSVAFYHKDASLEVIVAPDGTMEMHEGHGYGLDHVQANLGETTKLSKVLSELTRVCLPSDSFTSGTSTFGAASSRTWHFDEARDRTEGSRFSIASALVTV